MTVPPRSLLIIKPGSMGDVIHTLPVVSAIHNFWPQTKITWIVDSRWKPLLENHPAIAEIHTFPRQKFRGPRGWMKAFRWFCELPQFQADIAIDLQGLLRSAIMAKCTGSPIILGLRDAREFSSLFYNLHCEVAKNEHAVTRYMRCLEALKIPIPQEMEFTFYSEKTYESELLLVNYILIHPFARGVNKALSKDALTTMISHIAKYANMPIVLAGIGHVPQEIDKLVFNLVGKTCLKELINLSRRACFVISVDSGPMHLAAALGTPLLGIHTWSDPRLVGPYSDKAWIWQGGEIRKQDLQRPPLPPQFFSIRDAENVAKFVLARISTH